jgi:hypothetical protein
MYQCPGVVSLGGGSWGFYGCQGQITNTPTCLEIESPTQQSFPCAPIGKLPVLDANAAVPAGTKAVPMYQCPGIVSLGGGAWGFYGCQNQLSSTSSCSEIEYPSSASFGCSPAGKILLSDAPPAPPPGGTNVPMYQCPASQSLGGGLWGYYGCQSQLSSTSTCNVIEYPNQQNFGCTPAGTMTLLP